MRYSRTSRAAAGRAQVLPSVMREFFGRVSWTMIAVRLWGRLEKSEARGSSVHPRLRLDIGDLVGERVGVHRPVVDRHLALRVEPGERVLHPVLVVALGVVLARMRAAALGAVGGGMHGHHRLGDQVVELER